MLYTAPSSTGERMDLDIMCGSCMHSLCKVIILNVEGVTSIDNNLNSLGFL